MNGEGTYTRRVDEVLEIYERMKMIIKRFWLKLTCTHWLSLLIYVAVCGLIVYYYYDFSGESLKKISKNNASELLFSALVAGIPFVLQYFYAKPSKEFEDRLAELKAYSEYLRLCIMNLANLENNLKSPLIKCGMTPFLDMLEYRYDVDTLKFFCEGEKSIFLRAMQIETNKLEQKFYVEKYLAGDCRYNGNVENGNDILLVEMYTTLEKVIMCLDNQYGYSVPKCTSEIVGATKVAIDEKIARFVQAKDPQAKDLIEQKLENFKNTVNQWSE